MLCTDGFTDNELELLVQVAGCLIIPQANCTYWWYSFHFLNWMIKNLKIWQVFNWTYSYLCKGSPKISSQNVKVVQETERLIFKRKKNWCKIFNIKITNFFLTNYYKMHTWHISRTKIVNILSACILLTPHKVIVCLKIRLLNAFVIKFFCNNGILS